MAQNPSGPAPVTDLIIIGAGAAGVSAAVEAGLAGLQTVVLEAFPEPGGAAATSGGGCCLAGTPYQQQRGIVDSPELALQDWLEFGGDDADPAWAKLYLERSKPDVYDWLVGMGVEWDNILDHEGNTVPRWHHPKGGGPFMMATLRKACQGLPVAWRVNSPAVELVIEDGRVQGVVVETAGVRETLRAKAVLAATGGFTNNLEMLRQYIPDPGPGSRLLCGGALQSRGTGHQLLAAVGAHFVHMQNIWTYAFATPDDLDSTGTRGLVIRGLESELWVNAQGSRFHNEDLRGGGAGTTALMAQTPRTSWTIFDRSEANKFRIDDPNYRQQGLPIREKIEAFLVRSPYAHRGNTLEELAQAAGLPVAAFTDTVRRYNNQIKEGVVKDEFGRDLRPAQAVLTAPFYAVQCFPLARKNLGGVRTDLACRVLRADGSAIPGLYAAGEVAGMAGGHINGKAGLEGTMIGPSLFSGRIAGKAVAAAIGAA